MAESVVGLNLNDIAEELKNLTNEEIKNRIHMLGNNIKQYKLEMNKINSDLKKVFFNFILRFNSNFKTTKTKSNKINNFPGSSVTLSKFWILNQKWMKTSIHKKSLMISALLSKPVLETLFFCPFQVWLKAHCSNPDNS